MPGEGLVRFLANSGDASGAAAADPHAVERRSEPRTPTNWIGKIRLSDGEEIACTVKDVSKSGARLGLPDTVALPESFQLKVVGYDFLFNVRSVWRKNHCAGVRIERFAKQPPPAIEPEKPKPEADPAETSRLIGRRLSRFSPY
ncbi:PilZ domain-containing protein [Methylobacterium sp. C25]|uniref:PilZ domain-containing protein n=1 Tax=Methylobacterium sp. C25 TaxID=2721622 RepID=UPI0022798474|nr:PilZ domain-containing protein [Methylobacterium sp. C25]MCE4222860.1 PilZ domain-containing protein [Methylobacterium sp. C25]